MPLSRDVKQAIEYMRANPERRIRFADLVAASGVAERTLNKHFRTFLGMPPMRYLRRMRLAAARESLLTGASGASVTGVAIQHGFAHLGRFSLQYREIFGESPSTTLRFGYRDRDARRVVPVVAPPPRDLDAHSLAMRALPLVFASQSDASRRALELLERAMEIDPGHELATALAAWCHGQLVMFNATRSPAEEKACALRLARRAAALEAADPVAFSARCAVHTMAGEFDTAADLVARALALDPASAWAWGRSGWINSYLGNARAAIADFRRCLSLDPDSASRANAFVGIGSAHFHAGRYDAAARWLRRAVVEQPGAAWANRTLAVAYGRLGERRMALKSLDALRRYCPDLTVGQVVSAIPFRPDYLERLSEGLSELGLPA